MDFLETQTHDAMRVTASEPSGPEAPPVSMREAKAQALRRAHINRCLAHIYETSDGQIQTTLIGRLLHPVRLLTLATIASGAFMRVRLGHGRRDATIRPADLAGITAREVSALVAHVQEHSFYVIAELAHWLTTQTAPAVDPAQVALLRKWVNECLPHASATQAEADNWVH